MKKIFLRPGFALVLIILIVVLSAALVGTGGYLVYKKKIKKIEPVTDVTPTTESTSPSTEAGAKTTGVNKSDPTANWATYENKEYGFSFKYPSDKLKLAGDSRYLIMGFNWVDPKDPNYIIGHNDAIKIDDEDEGWYMSYTPRLKWTDDLTFEQILEKHPGYSSNLPVGKVVTVGGKKAYRIDKESSIELLYLVQDKHILKFVFTYAASQPPYFTAPVDKNQAMTIFNQMISTMQFKDITHPENTGYYKNDKYGFEFQYPKEWLRIADEDRVNGIVTLGWASCRKFCYTFTIKDVTDENWSQQSFHDEHIKLQDGDTTEKLVQKKEEATKKKAEGEYVVIGGEKAFKRVPAGFFRGNEWNQEIVYLIHNKHVYKIQLSTDIENRKGTYTPDLNNQEAENIMNQVISNFKFTN